MPGETAKQAISQPPRQRWRWIADAPWEHFAVWAFFLVVLCLLRHLLLVLFLTFLVCYLVRSVTGLLERTFWPGRERPWLERMASVTIFVALLAGVTLAVRQMSPLVVRECRELLTRVSGLDPDFEFHRLLARTVGAYEFRQEFGAAGDPRYEAELGKFRSGDGRGHLAYVEFPEIERQVNLSIVGPLDMQERGRLAAELSREPLSRDEFAAWLAKKQAASGGPAVEPVTEPANNLQLQRQWKESIVDQRLARAKSLSPYGKRLREAYESARQASPRDVPYDFDQFQKLAAAYSKGEAAFAAALGPTSVGSESDAPELRRTFEATKQRELAENWWAVDPVAAMVRQRAEVDLDYVVGKLGEQASRFASLLLGLPAQLITVLLLSLFITVDFPNLRSGVRRLRNSRLRFLFDDLLPGLAQLGNLIGKAFLAQALISCIDSLLVYLLLRLLGVESPLLLSAIVFLFSFIPVIGIILSSIPIVLMALTQTNGSFTLALWALGAVLVVHLQEATVLSPRIVGRLLHLHPVLGIVVLGIGEELFGLWGLLLAYPVAVYLISRVLGSEELPGTITGNEQRT